MTLRPSIVVIWLFTSGLASASTAAQKASSPAVAPAQDLPAASPRSASAAASPDKVRLGDEFVLTVAVRDSKDVRYELPAELTLGKDFDVVRVSADRSSKDGEVETRFEIHALLFDLGEKTIADIPLRAAAPDGEKRLLVPGPKVTGTGDLKEDDKAELKDIMPPVPVRVPRYTLLYALAGALAAAVLGLFALRWWWARKPRARAAPAAPPLPAHVRALRALETLQREDLPGQARHKELFFRVSEILRDYLGERFGLPALDMTTEELLASLSRTSTPGLDFPRFEAFCREGDLVRFARAEANTTSCKASVEQAFLFVRATSPTEPVAVAPSPAPSQPPLSARGA